MTLAPPEASTAEGASAPLVAASASGWSILVDCPLTRRKVTNAVFDPSGEPVFRSRHIWDCVEYLDAEGIETYKIECGGLTGREQVSALIARKV